MSKKVVLVGHCGPDSAYLRLAVSRALKNADISSADDEGELNQKIADGADLLLFNRTIDYGFNSEQGVELISQMRAKHPNLKFMLISNYPEAQQAAVQAGALPGFGKREIGTPKVTQLLKDALGE